MSAPSGPAGSPGNAAPTDGLPFSPAADRNKQPILDVLSRVVPACASILEIASGTGQHAAWFAAQRPGWSWLPSEREPHQAETIRQRCQSLPNVREALVLDVSAERWEGAPEQVDVVFCANMLHIAPWPTCAALMHGAARHLPAHGVLVLYGPFIVDGTPTAPGNVAFDADLRRRDPAWGLRRLDDVEAEAHRVGLRLVERVAMPSNNLTLVFQRAAPAGGD